LANDLGQTKVGELDFADIDIVLEKKIFGLEEFS
jgi:hypothetical protein